MTLGERSVCAPGAVELLRLSLCATDFSSRPRCEKPAALSRHFSNSLVFYHLAAERASILHFFPSPSLSYSSPFPLSLHRLRSPSLFLRKRAGRYLTVSLSLSLFSPLRVSSSGVPIPSPNTATLFQATPIAQYFGSSRRKE